MTTYIMARVTWERDYLLNMIALNLGNQCATARDLGIHRNTLTRKLRALGVTDHELKSLRPEGINFGGKYSNGYRRVKHN